MCDALESSEQGGAKREQVNKGDGVAVNTGGASAKDWTATVSLLAGVGIAPVK